MAQVAIKRSAFPNDDPVTKTVLSRYVVTLNPTSGQIPLSQQISQVNALDVVVQDGFWAFMRANFAAIGQHSMTSDFFSPSDTSERPYYDAATGTTVS